jgi:hypothetical protein
VQEQVGRDLAESRGEHFQSSEDHASEEQQDVVEQVHQEDEAAAGDVRQLPFAHLAPAVLFHPYPVADEDCAGGVSHYEHCSFAHSSEHCNQCEDDELAAHAQLHFVANRDIAQPVKGYGENSEEDAIAEQVLLA